MERNSKLVRLTMIALMAAVLCIIAPFSLPIGPVPISLANFVIYISVYVLGWKRGTVSCLVYLALGIFGVPVFSGFSGGIGKVMGPTGGYLVGYIFVVMMAGICIDYAKKHVEFRAWKRYAISCAGMVAGLLVCYAIGTVWLAVETGMSIQAALFAGVIPFIVGDVIKIGIAAMIGPVLQKRIKID